MQLESRVTGNAIESPISINNLTATLDNGEIESAARFPLTTDGVVFASQVMDQVDGRFGVAR